MSRVLDKFHELWKAEVEATGREPAGFLIGEDDWPRIWQLIYAENPVLGSVMLDEDGHGYMKFAKKQRWLPF